MLFIIIHQAYELWFKLIIHELVKTRTNMEEGNVLRAHHFMKRIVEIMKLLVDQIHLLETMTPSDFLAFRHRLNPASGFQSLQFREIQFLVGLRDEKFYKYFKEFPEKVASLKKRSAEKSIRIAFYELLGKRGFQIPADAILREMKDEQVDLEKIGHVIKPIYWNQKEYLDLFLLTESLIEFDEYFQLWKEHHVRVVERVIGLKKGTGGSSGVEYLKSVTAQKFFPALWALRTLLERR